MKVIYLLLLLFVPGALADGLPDLGEAAQTVMTPLEEQRIGEEIMREVATSGEIINDIEVIDYLQALGYRLASSSPDNHQFFSFFVVRDNSINAFALPGGVIGVHSGLLLAASSESELASVLSHEIGHVVQHHLARMMAQQQQDSWKSIAAMAFALLAARSDPQLAGGTMMATQAGAVQKQLNYSRDNEHEADRIGLQILDKAGFDTRAMPAFFETLQKGTRFYQGGAPSFLRTHPLTSERIADVRNRVEQLPYRQVMDSPEFQYVRAKLRAMNGSPQEAVSWFDDSLREKRYTSEAAQHYGLAVAHERAGNLQAARQELGWLRTHAPRHAMIETLGAHLEFVMGNPREAESQFQQALFTYPDHRGLIYGDVEALLAIGQPDAAIRLAGEKLQIYPHDAHLYELQSQGYTQQGRNLLRHQAQGEFYFYSYNLPAAVEQMELAVKSGDGDFYQLSIVEARLKQLRQLMIDAKDNK
ncbi:beta-barrel assembly-enhancing protease precursor [mine drainage metagenome]|uniref:Beta-barrel assembly-enhancing protease n=1 Tax=mine drainage metagenome TaxID=410659 RepID=A0A1J5Q7U7_9ZZZZ